MRITYKYRLYPSREQRKAIHFTIERCRLLYNRLLDERIHAYSLDCMNMLPISARITRISCLVIS
ncbi:helix-turn-helix domain-containing protein [Paenibacillus sp. YYML68]|uniref:helix-turn-helix domain-containing protein n=1 Tax=Paenibacillus sp. YYML68 TaxID=2909250 RepID=UPI0024933CBA|nr:helix-turn-helix domain-containing protein [Paenibacillus sp. YYML68]